MTYLLYRATTARCLYFISIGVFVFFFFANMSGQSIYRYAVAGAIYELLWLPMLASLALVPVFSVIVFTLQKGKGRLHAMAAFMLIVGTIFMMISA